MAMFHTNVLDNQIKALPTIKAISNTPIASFDTDIADRLVNLQVAVTATQSGSGTPSPSNPRAISGYIGANIFQRGKNLLSCVPRAESTSQNIKSTVYDDNRVVASGTSTGNGDIVFSVNNLMFFSGITYTFSLTGTQTRSGTLHIYFHEKNGAYLTSVGMTATTNYVNYTPSKTCEIDHILMRTFNGNTITLDCRLQLELGLAKTEYESYNGTTHTINFGQTVYGGSLDVITGKLTITHGYVSDLGSLSWTKGSKSFYADITGAKLYEQSAIPNMLCEIYSPVSYNDLVSEQYNEVCSIDRNLSIILIRDTNYATASDFSTAVTGKKAIYELDNPTVIQLSSEEVQAIVGTNNVYSDTGNVTELEYKITVGLAIS